jgi:hypothetical protein
MKRFTTLRKLFRIDPNLFNSHIFPKIIHNFVVLDRYQPKFKKYKFYVFLYTDKHLQELNLTEVKMTKDILDGLTQSLKKKSDVINT